MNRLWFYILVVSLLPTTDLFGNGAPETGNVNKLQYMYQLFYLPFSVTFREGRTVDDILPSIPDKVTGAPRLIKAEELQELDGVWNSIRDGWKKRSLLLSTPVPPNQSVRIGHHLASHNIPISRGPLDGLSINERIQLAELLKGKSPEIQATFKQLRFLKSFLGFPDEGKFNFFIVSANWCDSCKEYRALFEAYQKQFNIKDLNIHSLVVDDPKEEIFDRPLLKDIFPHPKRYTHESIPRFISLEIVDGKATILEEGEALKAVYERFLQANQGFLDDKSSLFRKKPRDLSSISPSSSSVGK